jgi:hypothetical protein
MTRPGKSVDQDPGRAAVRPRAGAAALPEGRNANAKAHHLGPGKTAPSEALSESRIAFCGTQT